MQVARSGNLLAVICTVMIQLRFPFYVFNFSRSILKLLTHKILRLQVANLVANDNFTTQHSKVPNIFQQKKIP